MKRIMKKGTSKNLKNIRVSLDQMLKAMPPNPWQKEKVRKEIAVINKLWEMTIKVDKSPNLAAAHKQWQRVSKKILKELDRK